MQSLSNLWLFTLLFTMLVMLQKVFNLLKKQWEFNKQFNKPLAISNFPSWQSNMLYPTDLPGRALFIFFRKLAVCKGKWSYSLMQQLKFDCTFRYTWLICLTVTVFEIDTDLFFLIVWVFSFVFAYNLNLSLNMQFFQKKYDFYT